MEREMTPDERAELVARLPKASTWADLPGLLAGAAGAGVTTGMFGWLAIFLLVRVLLPALGLAPQPLPWVKVVGIGLGLATAALFLHDALTRARALSSLRRLREADLAHGRITVDKIEVAALHRFREPEHFTELLVLVSADGRHFALIDDSTYDDDHDRPKRSSLRLGRQMELRRYPASGGVDTRFTGERLRRPKALTSNPGTWPPEGWITPEEFSRIDRAA